MLQTETVPQAAEELPVDEGFATRLLRIADLYFANCSICQAASIYLDIVRQYAGTPEAVAARTRLLQIVHRYGDQRRIRSIYERLEETPIS